MHGTDIHLLLCGREILNEIWHGGYIHLYAFFTITQSSPPLSVVEVLVLSVAWKFAGDFDFLQDTGQARGSVHPFRHYTHVNFRSGLASCTNHSIR